MVTYTPKSPGTASTLGAGEQPQVSVDPTGVIRVVFGQPGKIYCATSRDKGVSFSTPVPVADVPGMHLGMSRGPQIASSAHFSVITAMDKAGNIHCFRLDHASRQWTRIGTINDIPGSSPEGLISIAADRHDNFYAVWLDIRTGHHNQLYFSTLAGAAGRWSPNALIYRSPDGHVCECCKPSIHAEGNKVAVMFRNWLNGSRDLYLLRSSDKGKFFGQAQKLGTGTWKLNGCPMDGGGITIDPSGAIHTVWQREGIVYYCQPGQEEQAVAKGRTCSIAANARGIAISMQSGDTLKLIQLPDQKERIIGEGSFLQSALLSDNTFFSAWEQDNKIRFRKE